MKTALPLFALLAASAAADSPLPANPAWQHPVGDKGTIACAHRKQQHPGGCAPPCTHPPVAQHPGGDDTNVPCTHFKLEHPGGHDNGRKSPCSHWKNGRLEHPGGDVAMDPCGHWVAEHRNGDTVKVPCRHPAVAHPDGDEGKMPCPHWVGEHAGGDEAWLPCVHKLPVKRQEKDPPLDFYFDDKGIQDAVVEGFRKLRTMGVQYRWIRPLSVYYREPVKGNPDDNLDPFWSHYDPGLNCIVITKDPAGYMPPAGEDRRAKKLGTVYHEMGHALMQDRCVQITTKGGPHQGYQESDPAVAMSEGWGHFVALAILNERGAATASRNNSMEFEEARKKLTDVDAKGKTFNVVFTQKVEFRVAAVLWDLYDTHEDGQDKLSMDFRKLWEVYSPSLETLTKGPFIGDLENWLARLKKNNPGQAKAIDAVKDENLKAPR